MELGGDDLLSALQYGGIVLLLEAMVTDKSPFIVAAAAGALGWWAGQAHCGEALIQAPDAIPALLHVIERADPHLDLGLEPGVIQRYWADLPVAGQGMYIEGTVGRLFPMDLSSMYSTCLSESLQW